jgi:hypothetical protein
MRTWKWTRQRIQVEMAAAARRQRRRHAHLEVDGGGMCIQVEVAACTHLEVDDCGIAPGAAVRASQVEMEAVRFHPGGSGGVATAVCIQSGSGGGMHPGASRWKLAMACIQVLR